VTADPVQEIFVFPLNTVLFPDGVLPLKVFEQRYIEMTKACLRDNRPFGVCMIREGREVGTAAVPEPVGCFAAIESWDMPQLGLFHLIARGGGRFRIREMRVAPNHLISAAVEPLPPPLRNLMATSLRCQFTPTTPTPLSPSAAIVPEVWLPWPLSSNGSPSLLKKS